MCVFLLINYYGGSPPIVNKDNLVKLSFFLFHLLHFLNMCESVNYDTYIGTEGVFNMLVSLWLYAVDVETHSSEWELLWLPDVLLCTVQSGTSGVVASICHVSRVMLRSDESLI